MACKHISKFWTFRQNNSGGSFSVDSFSGISAIVIIEADSADHANERAKEIGLYFDGVAEDRDCACCGDRWYEAYGEPDDFPAVYGNKVINGTYAVRSKWVKGPEGYIHYKDGRIVPFDPEP